MQAPVPAAEGRWRHRAARWSRLGRGPDLAGRSFALITALPPLLITAWLLPGLPLLLAGRFFPVPMVLISVPAAVGLIMLTGMRMPGWWTRPRTEPETAPAAEPASGRLRSGKVAWGTWGGLAGTVVVAAGFGAWQFLVNSPQLIVIRDPGAYVQIGYWIAKHGTLPIPQAVAAFGGPHPGLTFSSLGFLSHGTAVVPRLAAGLPITLAAGLWAHGVPGAAALSPLLGALAVLSVGGLTGRLAGPRWAPAGAFVLAVILPEVYTSRTAFSETLTQVLLFGGLCLVVDSLAARESRTLAAIGGLALGLTVLVTPQALLILLPVLVFLGALAAGRRQQALPLAGGLLAGAGYGLAGDIVLTRPALSSVTPSLRMIGFLAAGFAAVTLAGAAVGMVGVARRRAGQLLAARPLRWLPEAAAIIVIAIAVALVVRPYVQTVRGGANPYVAVLQRLSQLPADPRRLYAEDTLYWVIWYLGAPALVLGVAGLAMLTRRSLRALFTWRDPAGTARVWALPLMVIGWGAITVLWQPGTVPDQPWASRRLVPVLLPGLVVAAVWVAAWLAARARERGAGLPAISAAVACFVAALAVPPAMTTFAVGVKHPAPPTIHPVAIGLALHPTGDAELTAIRELCGSIPAGSSVVILDQAAARQFAPVIRGTCGLPTAVMAGASTAQVEDVIGGVARIGRRPALLASRAEELAAYGSPPRRILDLTTPGDAHMLTRPPSSTWPERHVLWLSNPGGTAGA